jgi:hypothetical protein
MRAADTARRYVYVGRIIIILFGWDRVHIRRTYDISYSYRHIG